ncbi:MAG: class I SAM-dependent DNA methyltransferase [bacterium]|nr:class I SAM-dependent DNA methyltransferase [bacterium]
MELSQFNSRWSKAKLSERKHSQSHFNDLCDVLGVPRPAAEGEESGYCFEYGVSKSSGGNGWADVFKRGCFGWEYKGEGRDLGRALTQLRDYQVSLHNPPLLITCDLKRVEITTNFQNSKPETYEFTFEELLEQSKLKPDYTNYQLLQFAFDEATVEKLRVGLDPLKVTEQAAENVGSIAERMRNRGIEPLDAAHFVMKLVFCMFAEDIGLLKQRFFTEILNNTRHDASPGAAQPYLAELFSKMDSGGNVLATAIPPFNGGLFDGSPPLPLQNGEANVLRLAAAQDWSMIQPAIFGTLLERAIDPARRQQLGAHYTHPDDIMKVIEPVVLDPLREEWITVRAELELLAGPKQPRVREERVKAFLKRLREVRIFDPACGSGNFLYLALKAVMDLEEEVRSYAASQNIPVHLEARVGPEILLGQDIDPYAVELASTVIWIGYIQHRLSRSGSYSDRPILRRLDNIKLGDSILDVETGKRPQWPQCDFIVGNPPFLGGKRLRKGTLERTRSGKVVQAAKPGLGDEYVDRLHSSYEGSVGAESDLCCYFFEQARNRILQGDTSRAGLLATSSIRGITNRGILERINDTTLMFDVWDDEQWILDGANVNISIVCFGATDAIPPTRKIDGVVVPQIHADLSSGLDLTKAKKLSENKGIAFMGDKKNGQFEVSPESAKKMLAAKGNPNGRPNSDVVVPWITGKTFLTPSQRKWIIDFGTDIMLEDAAQYVLPFQHLQEHVYAYRQTLTDYPLIQENWWIHGSPAYEMRKAFKTMQRALATVRHTHTRTFRFIDPKHLLDSALIGFAIDDWCRLGILESGTHKVWTIERGRSDLRGWTRYTPTTVFQSFAFPRISPHLRERYPLASNPLVDRTTGEARFVSEAEADALVAAVEVAARELYEARDQVVFNDPDCPSYTRLYQQNPPWLKLAHEKLDRAVLACYGLPADASKHDILELLLEENLAREAARTGKKRKVRSD